jgi:hypothetical protein
VTLAPDPALQGALRGALALLLLAAAHHKLRDPVRFREALAGYGMAPARALPPLARLLIAAELGLGLALAIPASGPAPAWLAAALFAAYAAAMAAGLARGRRGMDCGCGARPQPLREGLLARNGALIGIALWAALPPDARALAAFDAVTVLGGAAALAALYGALDAALANAARARVLRS